jgi:predicted nucleic acid-binding protein
MLKTNNLFVDTSGWACYLDDRDPCHSSALALIQRVTKRRWHLVTTNYIITELVALLSSRYHLPRQRVIMAINHIKMDATVEIVYIDQAFDNRAWKLLEARLDKEWSLVDASSFLVMEYFGMTEALTTDHHFEQAGFIQVPEETRRYR